jgi:hypothetical protein
MVSGSTVATADDHGFGPEVFVADTDVILGDACDALTSGQPSVLLRALNSGAAIAFMSERAFHEIGRMSAPAARSRGVDHDALRALITKDYLPRIPVVIVPETGSGHWMPSAQDVADPDDVAHVSLARLISASAVYSHDRHLRRPGHAPATRAAYDQRLMHVSIMSSRREAEQGVGGLISLAGSGASGVVSWTSVRFAIKPTVVGLALLAAISITAYLVLASTGRRQRIAVALAPVIDRVGNAYARSEQARRELGSARLITTQNPHRLESQVATYLARHPDSSMRSIAESLGLNARSRRKLSAALRSHPSFQLVSRYGWAVGLVQRDLQTAPSSSWRPRPTCDRPFDRRPSQGGR